MLKAVIIDDEPKAIQGLTWELSNFGDEIEVIATFTEPEKALYYISSTSIDCLFLDVEMPTMDGFQFLERLDTKDFAVIITTAYNEYAIKALKKEAIDYLLKPITFARFFRAIEKFRSLKKSTPDISTEVVPTDSQEYLYVRKDRKQVKVVLDEILFIESVKDYIKIVLAHENHLVKHSITAFHEKLDDRFIRIHRSFIVNRDKITAYTKHDVEIGKVEIPVGESYKDVLALLG